MARYFKKSKGAGKINHTKTTIDGITFASKLESKYYEYLKDLKEQGIVKDFTLQPKFLLQEKFIIIEGQTIVGSDENFNKLKRKYKAPTYQDIEYISDFEVEYADGHIEIVDTKGEETADFKLKKKMLLFKYPHIDLRVITQDKDGSWIPFSEYKKKENAKKRLKKIKENGVKK